MQYLKSIILLIALACSSSAIADNQTTESVMREATMQKQCKDITNASLSTCTPGMVLGLGASEVFYKSVMNQTTATLTSFLVNSMGRFGKAFGLNALPTDVEFPAAETSSGVLYQIFKFVETAFRWVFIAFFISFGCRVIFSMKTNDAFRKKTHNWAYLFINIGGVLMMCGLPYLANVIFSFLFAGLAVAIGVFIFLHTVFYTASANDAAATVSLSRQMLKDAAAPVFDMLVLNSMHNTRNENKQIIDASVFDGVALTLADTAFNRCIQTTEPKRSAVKGGLLVNGRVDRTRACMSAAGVRAYNVGAFGYGGSDKAIEAGFAKLSDAAEKVAYMMNQKMCSQTLAPDDRRNAWADYRLAYEFCMNKDTSGKLIVGAHNRLSFLPSADIQPSAIKEAKDAALAEFAESFTSFSKHAQTEYANSNFKISDIFSATLALFSQDEGSRIIQNKIMEEMQKIKVNNNDFRTINNDALGFEEKQNDLKNVILKEAINRANLFDYTSSISALRNEESYAQSMKRALIRGSNDLNSHVYQRSGFTFTGCFDSTEEMNKCITPQLNQVSSFMSDTLVYLDNLSKAGIIAKITSYAADATDSKNLKGTADLIFYLTIFVLSLTIIVAVCALYPFIAFLTGITYTTMCAFSILLNAGASLLKTIFMSSKNLEQEKAMNVHFKVMMNCFWLLINPSLCVVLLFVNLAVVCLVLPLMNELVFSISEAVLYDNGSVLTTFLKTAIQFFVFQVLYLATTIGVSRKLKEVSKEFEVLMQVSSAKDIDAEKVFSKIESALQKIKQLGMLD